MPGAPPSDASVSDAQIMVDAAMIDAGVRAPTPETVARELAQAECGFVTRCRELEALQSEDCPHTQTASWLAHIQSRSDFNAVIEDARTCHEGFVTAACWDQPREYGQACWPVQSHGRTLGEACVHAQDCSGGFCLSSAPGLVCGQCVPWRTLDDPCGEDPEHACGPDAVCEAGTCLPLPAIGTGCAGRCQGLLDCPFDFEGITCLPPLVAGELCDPPFGNGRTCPRERALACVDNICASATLVALGERCDETLWCNSPQQFCAQAGRCEITPTVAIGEACQDHRHCETTAFCEDARCAIRGPQDAECTSNEGCQTPLACLGSPRTCQVAVNLTCP